jgi:biopolymer transport protein ExbB
MIEIFKDGGPVMYPLLACSIITLTVIIERTFFWIKVSLNYHPDIIDQILELSQNADWEAIRKIAAGSKNYIVRTLVSGILHRDYSMVKAMESAASEEIRKMRNYMGILDTMITVAPLLGILGTVTGIISSFNVLGAGIENPEAVTGGIAEALITTAAGLMIAIPAVFPYNYFTLKIEQAALSIEKYATSLEIVYEKLESNSKKKREAME